MTLLGWKIFGFNLFGTFVFSVLALLGTAWFVSETASLLGERRWYVNAGIWFAATVGAFTYGTTAQMEIYICLFYAASWWAAVHFLHQPEREVKWLYLAFAIAGLSALVKSPLYSVLWVLSFLTYLLISGEWLLFKSKHLYRAWVLGAVVGLVWFVVIYCIDRERFWQQYFLQETFGKRDGNGGTFFSLWIPVVYMAFPFTLLVVTAVRSILIGRRTASVARFVFAWCFVPAVFFTLHPYKTSPYLFILVPALAILVDWGCFRSNRTRTFLWMTRVTGVFVFTVLFLVSVLLYHAKLVPIWLLLAIAFSGVAAGVSAWMGWMRTFAIVFLATILLFRMGLVEVARSDTQGLKEILNRPEPYRVAMLDEAKNIWHEVGILSVAMKTPMKRLYGLDDVVDFLASQGGTIILSDEEWDKYQLTLQDYLKPKGLTLQSSLWKRFKRRQKIPLKEILLKGKVSTPDFDEMVLREFRVVRAIGL